MDEPEDAVKKAREDASRKLLTALQLHHSGILPEPQPDAEPAPPPVLVSEPCPVPERVVMPETQIDKIKRVVCRNFGISRSDMMSDSRKARVCYPRQIAMYMTRRLTGASFPKIGRRFGGRDHTTALHAFQKIERMAAFDTVLAAQLAEMGAELSQ